jgi:hypothetical protein
MLPRPPGRTPLPEAAMSKRPHTDKTRLAPDPSAGNVRDPQQRGNELDKHDTPKREDPTQRKKARGPVGDGS